MVDSAGHDNNRHWAVYQWYDKYALLVGMVGVADKGWGLQLGGGTDNGSLLAQS